MDGVGRGRLGDRTLFPFTLRSSETRNTTSHPKSGGQCRELGSVGMLGQFILLNLSFFICGMDTPRCCVHCQEP